MAPDAPVTVGPAPPADRGEQPAPAPPAADADADPDPSPRSATTSDWDEIRTAFVRKFAHEINTPLTALVLSVQGLPPKLGTAWTEAQLKGFDRIKQATQRVLRLGRSLDAALRILSDGPPRTHGPLDASKLVAGCVARMEPLFAKRNIHLEARIDDDLWVVGDRHELTLLVDHLLDNARAFGRPGGRAEVDLGAEAGRLALTVHDDGAGLPPGPTDHLFAPFGRGNRLADDATQGNGLGLFIARHVARGCGGTVEIKSAGLDQGATATAYLPRHEAARGADATPDADAPPDPSTWLAARL